MKLIGMLDSPYVRRVAIALQVLGLKFDHQSLSVFRGYAEFQLINPVVKAPSLLFDDGEVLMDSTLILQYAEAAARPRSLLPSALPELQRDLRVTGLALAACEKAVQIVYERGLRPAEKQHQPWLDRVGEQLRSACGALEEELTQGPPASPIATQGSLTSAVIWYFIQQMVPEAVTAAEHPSLVALSAQAEALPEFMAAPHGEGTFVWKE